jgi:hypothetical protein
MGSGLQRICKLYGAIVINGERFVWDYAQDRGVPEKEMPVGSERRKLSDFAMAEQMRAAIDASSAPYEASWP